MTDPSSVRAMYRIQRMVNLVIDVLLISVVSLLLVHKNALALPAGFQEFFVPLPATQTRTVFVAIDTDPVPSTTMHYVVGVTASADNTTVYYDHWENGYTTGATGDEVITLNKGQVYRFESSNIPHSTRDRHLL